MFAKSVWGGGHLPQVPFLALLVNYGQSLDAIRASKSRNVCFWDLCLGREGGGGEAPVGSP